MEIVGRMMDGSISYPPNEPRETPIVLGPKLGQDQKMGYLQRVPVLENCTRRQLRAISRIATVLETPAGQVLARAGEPGDHFFFIIDGAARVEVPPQSHHRVGPGEFFGEMSLLDGGPRSATVLADTPVRLLVVHRRDFWKLLKRGPRADRANPPHAVSTRASGREGGERVAR
jgi:CRP/FNR family transcriptional regulator, cyclic AMP receptor protein